MGGRREPAAKAQALALLLTGNSIRYVARTVGVPRATVGRWALELREDVRQRRCTFDDLVAEYVVEGFEAQFAMLHLFSDEDWLRRQDARSLALTFGILNDKLVRILAAYVPADQLHAGGEDES